MRFLLDTHGLIWYSTGDRRLSSVAQSIVDDPESEVFISIATVWEMSIKESKNKLGLKSGVFAVVQNAIGLGLRLLPIELSHVLAVQHLPPHHGDPFDRLLIAQAKAEVLTIVSRDATFDAYNVKRVW